MLVIIKKKNNKTKKTPKKPPKKHKNTTKKPQQTILGSIKTADLQFASKDTQAYSYIPPEEQV